MKKNNAMSELASRTRAAGPKPTASSRTQVHRSYPRHNNLSYKYALKRSAGLIRNISIAVAVLFICTVAVTAAIILSPSDEAKPIVADFTLGELSAQGDEQKAKTVTKTEASDISDKYKVSFVFYKKEDVTCTTAKRTVGELIELLGIQLDEHELLKTDLTAVIDRDMEINVDNVSYDTVTEDFEIDYEVKYVDVESIPKGTKQVHQQGSEGIRTVEYRVTYVNGVEIEREKTGEYVSREPVTMIIYNGVGGMVNIGGTYYSYSSTFECKSTVYSGGGSTASGIPASENVIAVDPSVIPLGSRVYIEGVGIRIAADTGGAIKGKFIDIYFNSSNPAYYSYGVKYVKVYVLD